MTCASIGKPALEARTAAAFAFFAAASSSTDVEVGTTVVVIRSTVGGKTSFIAASFFELNRERNLEGAVKAERATRSGQFVVDVWS